MVVVLMFRGELGDRGQISALGGLATIVPTNILEHESMAPVDFLLIIDYS
jgi:hypothetical protein